MQSEGKESESPERDRGIIRQTEHLSMETPSDSKCDSVTCSGTLSGLNFARNSGAPFLFFK